MAHKIRAGGGGRADRWNRRCQWDGRTQPLLKEVGFHKVVTCDVVKIPHHTPKTPSTEGVPKSVPSNMKTRTMVTTGSSGRITQIGRYEKPPEKPAAASPCPSRNHKAFRRPSLQSVTARAAPRNCNPPSPALMLGGVELPEQLLLHVINFILKSTKHSCDPNLSPS